MSRLSYNPTQVFCERNQSLDGTQREFEMTITYDRELCDAMCREIEDSIRHEELNILMQPLHRTTPIGIIGEMAFFTEQRTADVRVVEADVHAVRIPKSVVTQAMTNTELREVVRPNVNARFASGEVVSSIDDQHLQEFLGKIFSLNQLVDTPAIS